MENIEEKIYDIEFGNDFLDVPLKAQATQEKKRIWISLKLKTFVHQQTILVNEEIAHRMGQIFAIHISDKKINIQMYFKTSYNSIIKK